MNYKITIVRKEENKNYTAEVAEYESMNKYRNGMNYPDSAFPNKQIVTDALICELTDEQFKKIKAECFKVFE